MAAMARILPDFLSLRPENGGTQAATPKLPRGPRPGSIRRECGRSQLLPTRSHKSPPASAVHCWEGGGATRNSQCDCAKSIASRTIYGVSVWNSSNFFADLYFSSHGNSCLMGLVTSFSLLGKPLSRLRKNVISRIPVARYVFNRWAQNLHKKGTAGMVSRDYQRVSTTMTLTGQRRARASVPRETIKT